MRSPWSSPDSLVRVCVQLVQHTQMLIAHHDAHCHHIYLLDPVLHSIPVCIQEAPSTYLSLVAMNPNWLSRQGSPSKARGAALPPAVSVIFAGQLYRSSRSACTSPEAGHCSFAPFSCAAGKPGPAATGSTIPTSPRLGIGRLGSPIWNRCRKLSRTSAVRCGSSSWTAWPACMRQLPAHDCSL